MTLTDALGRLEKIAEACTPGPWHPPHLSTAKDKNECQCVYVLCDSLNGSVCDISVERHKPFSKKWGDNPPLEQAKANGALIAALHPGVVRAMVGVCRAAMAMMPLVDQMRMADLMNAQMCAGIQDYCTDPREKWKEALGVLEGEIEA